jgi:signal transduction histidine kinase
MVCKELRSLLTGPEVPQSLSSRGIELLDKDMDEAVKFIQTAVIRLSNIIDALLRLSRAGRVDYLCEIIDLNSLVRRIIESQASTISTTGAAVEIEDLPAVWGDPTAVEQIFANLIGNALNYLSPDRRGQIEVGSIVGPDAAEEVTYFVRDNGIGIPAEFHGKIFQAFQRLRPDIGAGEGVGLMLVRRIVERHGGRIWFESGTSGTTFFVSLPVNSTALATTFDASLA